MTLGVMGGGQTSNYVVPRSLRVANTVSGSYMDVSAATAGNRTTWTVSMWVKRGKWDPNSTTYERLLYDSNTGAVGSIDNCALRFNNNYLELFFNGSSSGYSKATTPTVLDFSAWNHYVVAVDTTQALSANRAKLYINNIQIPLTQTVIIAQNYQTGLTANGSIRWCAPSNEPFIGHIAECYLIDGLQLTPSSFARFDESQAWVPKLYTGSYGTNGGYWNFKNNTSLTTLAYDYSGNGRNGSLTGHSLTGSMNSSVLDSPTTINSDIANYAILNNAYPNIFSGVYPQKGGLDIESSSAHGISTYGMSRGKWYWEVTCNSTSSSAATAALCYTLPSSSPTLTTSVSVPIGNTYGIRFDAGAGTFDYTADGTNFTSITTGLSSNGPYHAYMTGASLAHINFGQLPFKYTPPAGYLKLNSFNLPTPIRSPQSVAYATTYTGTGATRDINSSIPFAADLVLIKAQTTYQARFVDSVRGSGNALVTNSTAGSVSEPTGVTFTSNGFSLGADVNYNDVSGNRYYAMQWKKSANAGLDIVSYTGTGVARTIAHSLGAAPGFIIVKRTDATGGNWAVYHSSMTSASYFCLLNTQAAQTSDTTYWNGTAPTSSVFSVGTNADTNASGGTYIAYLWAEVPGYSKIGHYIGNGIGSSFNSMSLGFKPQFILSKSVNDGTTGFWTFTARDFSGGGYLTSGTGQTTTGYQLTSHGLNLTSSSAVANPSGQRVIYIAFAGMGVNKALSTMVPSSYTYNQLF